MLSAKQKISKYPFENLCYRSARELNSSLPTHFLNPYPPVVPPVIPKICAFRHMCVRACHNLEYLQFFLFCYFVLRFVPCPIYCHKNWIQVPFVLSSPNTVYSINWYQLTGTVHSIKCAFRIRVLFVLLNHSTVYSIKWCQ